MNKLHSGKIAAVVALGLGVLALAAPASAQTRMRVDIPFPFVAGSQSLPAGEYNLVIDANFSFSHLDSVTNGSIHRINFQPGVSRPVADTGKGVLQFQRYGDRYFLSAVWRPGRTDGLATHPSRRLIEAAKNGAAGEAVNVDTDIK